MRSKYTEALVCLQILIIIYVPHVQIEIEAGDLRMSSSVVI